MTTVKHVQEALSMLSVKSFDLVLSDVHMPDTNGFELLRQVDQDFNLPVIRKSLYIQNSGCVHYRLLLIKLTINIIIKTFIV